MLGISFSKCFSPLPALTICNHSAIISGYSIGDLGVYGAGAYYAGLNEKNEAIVSKYASTDFQSKTIFQVVKENIPGSITAVVTGKGWVGEAWQDFCDVVVT